MPTVVVTLNEVLFEELEQAARSAREHGFGPAEFATEAVESVLASRRLPRVTRGKVGARITVAEPEPITHRVLLPEATYA